MNDDLQEVLPKIDNEVTASAATQKPQPIGVAFSIALALVGLLVLLIIFLNIPGIKASAGISITRSDWALQSYADTTGTLVPSKPGTQVTAIFGNNSRVSGSAGCNQYTATYTVRDFAISISPPVSTKIFCGDPGVMQQESSFLNDLVRAVELRISESNLRLYDATGKPVLVFVKG
ncbi:MAG: META domain-containing protein [Methanoregula sp.]|jgi:heat shock protein HslJ